MNKSDLRIVFMGTPEFAVGTLQALVEGGYNVVGVVTQPDKPVGRHGSVLRASAVKEYALGAGLPVLQPVKMKDEAFLDALREWRADLQVVVAFRLLPETVWAMPRYGTFNVHAALLPKYRGAAPINWAIINGETRTGVTTFFLDNHVDTGRIILQRAIDLPDDADVEDMYGRLMRLGAQAAVETVDRLLEADGHLHGQDQQELEDSVLTPQNAIAPKLFKDNTRIDWRLSGKRVYDFIRGLSPVPCAWTLLSDGSRTEQLKVFHALKTERKCTEKPGTLVAVHGRLYVATGDEWLEIGSLQVAGKKRMDARAFLNGFHDIELWHVES